MNLALFYDTETTGLPLFKEPSSDPSQPHIVELAAALVDTDTMEPIASMHMVAKPDGWVIPDEVAAIHGITTDRALAIGVDESLIVRAFIALHGLAQVRVGHNQSFDARILRIGLKRFGYSEDEVEAFKAAPADCTCYGARPFTALAKNKLPTLSEAYLHFTGTALVGAHSAKADTMACAEIYWHIKAAKAA